MFAASEQLDVNGARTLLFGRAWSACCNKTQSVHADDLFILIAECLLLFQNSAWLHRCPRLPALHLPHR
jgi:hypothetical protein